MKKFLVIASALLLAACGKQLEGAYSVNVDVMGHQMNAGSLEFKSGHKVVVNGVSELTYEIDGTTLKAEGPNGAKVIMGELIDEGTIKGPGGILFKKSNKPSPSDEKPLVNPPSKPSNVGNSIQEGLNKQ